MQRIFIFFLSSARFPLSFSISRSLSLSASLSLFVSISRSRLIDYKNVMRNESQTSAHLLGIIIFECYSFFNLNGFTCWKWCRVHCSNETHIFTNLTLIHIQPMDPRWFFLLLLFVNYENNVNDVTVSEEINKICWNLYSEYNSECTCLFATIFLLTF